MADPDIRNAPGADATMASYSSATKSMQTLATEMQRMSKESFDATTQLVEKLRNAKTLEEVVAIQTTFMQQSFTSYADYTRRFSEVMLALPMELARQGRSAFQQGSEAMTKATHEAGEQVQKAGEQFSQHHG